MKYIVHSSSVVDFTNHTQAPGILPVNPSSTIQERQPKQRSVNVLYDHHFNSPTARGTRYIQPHPSSRIPYHIISYPALRIRHAQAATAPIQSPTPPPTAAHHKSATALPPRPRKHTYHIPPQFQRFFAPVSEFAYCENPSAPYHRQ